MSDRPVPQANFTTTGQVRKSKNATGSDMSFFSLECRVTSASALIKHPFGAGAQLPANASVEFVHIHPLTASVIATGTDVGIGVTGNPDEYLEETEGLIDAVGENVTFIATAVAPSTSAKSLFLHSTNGSGSGAGTITGDWLIRITGRIIQPIVT